MVTENAHGAFDPRYDGLYQRGGGAGSRPPTAATATPPTAAPYTAVAPAAPGQPLQTEGTQRHQAEAPSGIREVDEHAVPSPHQESGRNPFDVWMWVVTGALVALGLFFAVAPVIYQPSFEAYPVNQSSSVYLNPWYNQTTMLSIPLVLVGSATAVAQLILLSLRHTARSR